MLLVNCKSIYELIIYSKSYSRLVFIRNRVVSFLTELSYQQYILREEKKSDAVRIVVLFH